MPQTLCTVLPQQKRSGPDLQHTSGHTTAPLLRMSVRRRCRSQACGNGQMSRRRHTLTQWHSLNKKSLPLLVLSTVSVSMRAWISSSTSTDQSHVWVSLLLLLSLAICPAPDKDTWPKELKKANSTDTHINLVPFILETTNRPAPHAKKFISNLMRDTDNPPLVIRQLAAAIT